MVISFEGRLDGTDMEDDPKYNPCVALMQVRHITHHPKYNPCVALMQVCHITHHPKYNPCVVLMQVRHITHQLLNKKYLPIFECEISSAGELWMRTGHEVINCLIASQIEASLRSKLKLNQKEINNAGHGISDTNDRHFFGGFGLLFERRNHPHTLT